MTNALSASDLEALASEIGKNIYIDVAKWHLYLADAHLDVVLAKQLAPLLSAGTLEESQVMQVLSALTVSLGGGKRELPLIELLPMQCQVNLMDLLEDFQRRL
ncbi:DUF3181 family protein [Altericista sp. CCNU0014]|uniref:DUF3181 family protein n=1 Tax=Altericista sp. CCNU0014 TaxID=3082949 RepID=UPI00384CFAA0